MITLAIIAVLFAFLAAVCGFNGTSIISGIVAIALVLMKYAP